MGAGFREAEILIMQSAPDNAHHAHHGHREVPGGVVMNENTDRLPRDCVEISGQVEFHVRAGAEFADTFPGSTFTYDQHSLEAPACSLVTVVFENRDEVRHQWMVHGLPRYLYPGGMFHIEANGGETVEGSFIVPSDRQSYLVHCDLTQHMEKGMKAQLLVAGGSGDLWSVPGVSGDFYPAEYPAGALAGWIPVILLVALLGASILLRRN